MISEPRCRLEIARIKMSVPLYEDEETTREIARDVEARIARIESETDIIDTQKNAVIAAFEYAVEKRMLEKQHIDVEQNLATALQRLTEQLKDLTKRFRLDPLPRDKA